MRMFAAFLRMPEVRQQIRQLEARVRELEARPAPRLRRKRA
jgi:hypothetical protein